MLLNAQFNKETFAFFVGLFGLGLSVFSTYNGVTQGGKNLRVGLVLIFFMVLVSNVAVLASIRPLELAILGDVILTLSTSSFMVFLVRQHYKLQSIPKNDFQIWIEFHTIHNRQVHLLLTELAKRMANWQHTMPSQAESLNLFLSTLSKVLLLRNQNLELRMSVLETMPKGEFKVVAYTPNISLPEKDAMETQFRWSGEPVGTAGKCVAASQTILCEDITEDEKNHGWIPVGADEKGSILCIPIPYPRNYKRQKEHESRWMGVLSISCSKKGFLKQDHVEQIKKLYLDTLVIVMLIYKVSRIHY